MPSEAPMPWLLATGAAATWVAFVGWRLVRLMRAKALKSARYYERKGRYHLAPEYHETTSAILDRRRNLPEKGGPTTGAHNAEGIQLSPPDQTGTKLHQGERPPNDNNEPDQKIENSLRDELLAVGGIVLLVMALLAAYYKH